MTSRAAQERKQRGEIPGFLKSKRKASGERYIYGEVKASADPIRDQVE